MNSMHRFARSTSSVFCSSLFCLKSLLIVSFELTILLIVLLSLLLIPPRYVNIRRESTFLNESSIDRRIRSLYIYNYLPKGRSYQITNQSQSRGDLQCSNLWQVEVNSSEKTWKKLANKPPRDQVGSRPVLLHLADQTWRLYTLVCFWWWCQRWYIRISHQDGNHVFYLWNSSTIQQKQRTS